MTGEVFLGELVQLRPLSSRSCGPGEGMKSCSGGSCGLRGRCWRAFDVDGKIADAADASAVRIDSGATIAYDGLRTVDVEGILRKEKLAVEDSSQDSLALEH